jgi:hypothetical protein
MELYYVVFLMLVHTMLQYPIEMYSDYLEADLSQYDV